MKNRNERMKNEIKDIIISSIEELNEEHNSEIEIKISSNSTLYGEGGELDSLGLVTFLVLLEQNLEDKFNKVITIADEKAMSQKNSPFSTIDSLVEYIEILLSEDS